MAALPQQTLQLSLLDDPHSEYSAKVKVALRAKILNFDVIAVSCSGDVRAVNPLGKIPALVVVDGATGARDVVLESEVIVEFLEDAFPSHPPLLPREPLARSKARLVARYHDLYLEPALRRLYPQMAPSVRDAAVVQEATAGLLARLAELQALLPPPAAAEEPAAGPGGGQQEQARRRGGGALALGGTSLTTADVGYPAAFHYIELLLPHLGVGGPPGHCARLDWEGLGLARVGAWRDALWAQPAVEAVLAELRPAADEWLREKLRS